MFDNDHNLIKRTAHGDLSAFEELVKKHQNSVINFIYRYIGDKIEAEDLSQEVFLKVFKFAKQYKPEAKFTTWLYRIITNLCLNYLRKKKHISFISLDTPVFVDGEKFTKQVSLPNFLNPDAVFERQEKESTIRKAIDSLPKSQRIAVLLQRFEGLSYKEISGIMKCSVSSVESLLFRAKQTLKERLKKDLEER